MYAHIDKEMGTHSSILAWRLPRTEEPGRLQSMGSQESTQRTPLPGAAAGVSRKGSQGQLVPRNLSPKKALSLKACLDLIIYLLIRRSKYNLPSKMLFFVLFFWFILSLEDGVIPGKWCNLWGEGTWGLDCNNAISCMTSGTSFYIFFLWTAQRNYP